MRTSQYRGSERNRHDNQRGRMDGSRRHRQSTRGYEDYGTREYGAQTYHPEYDRNFDRSDERERHDYERNTYGGEDWGTGSSFSSYGRPFQNERQNQGSNYQNYNRSSYSTPEYDRGSNYGMASESGSRGWSTDSGSRGWGSESGYGSGYRNEMGYSGSGYGTISSYGAGGYGSSRGYESSGYGNRDYSEGRHYGEGRSFTGGYGSSNERNFGEDRGYRYENEHREEGMLQKIGRFFGVGPKGYRRSDDRIREDVSDALERHPHIDASDIEVDVKEGVVSLSGHVDSRHTKRLAEYAIEHLSGVKDVTNNLRVRPQEHGFGSTQHTGAMSSTGSSSTTGTTSTSSGGRKLQS